MGLCLSCCQKCFLDLFRGESVHIQRGDLAIRSYHKLAQLALCLRFRAGLAKVFENLASCPNSLTFCYKSLGD